MFKTGFHSNRFGCSVNFLFNFRSIMSNAKSSVRNVEQSTESPTMGSKDFPQISPCKSSWSCMQILQVIFVIPSSLYNEWKINIFGSTLHDFAFCDCNRLQGLMTSSSPEKAYLVTFEWRHFLKIKIKNYSSIGILIKVRPRPCLKGFHPDSLKPSGPLAPLVISRRTWKL
jgi:hypothetical protein